MRTSYFYVKGIEIKEFTSTFFANTLNLAFILNLIHNKRSLKLRELRCPFLSFFCKRPGRGCNTRKLQNGEHIATNHYIFCTVKFFYQTRATLKTWNHYNTFSVKSVFKKYDSKSAACMSRGLHVALLYVLLGTHDYDCLVTKLCSIICPETHLAEAIGCRDSKLVFYRLLVTFIWWLHGYLDTLTLGQSFRRFKRMFK